MAAVGRGNLREAATLFEQVVTDHPDDVYAQLKLGDIWVQLDEWESALRAYKAALQLYVTRSETGKAARVCASMWNLLDGQSLSTPAIYLWAVEVANVYVFLDRLGDAFTIFDRLVQSKIAAGELAEAERHLRFMLAVAPNAPKPVLRLAELRLAEGNTAGAVTLLRNGAEALAKLQHDAVGGIYERILALEPDAEIARRLAEFRLKKGSPEEVRLAFRAIKIAVEIDRSDLGTLRLLASYFEITNDPKRVIRVLKEMAQVAKNTGDAVAFQEVRRRLVALAPDDPELNLFSQHDAQSSGRTFDGSLMIKIPEATLAAAPVAGDFSVITRLPADLAADSTPRDRATPGLRHEVEHLYPHTIAYAFRALRSGGAVDSPFIQNANVVGVVLRFLVAVARSERIALDSSSKEVLRATLEEFGKPRSDGTDLSTVRSDGEALMRTDDLGMLRGLIDPSDAASGFKGAPLLRIANDLIELRNRLIHRQRGEGPAPADQDRMGSLVLKLLRELTFLGELILVVPQSAQVRDDIKIHRCLRLAGYSEDFEEIAVECDLDLEHGRVYLLSVEDQRVLPLYPFFLLARCEGRDDCGKKHLFCLEMFDRGKANYVSMQGHRLRRREGFEDIEIAIVNDAYEPGSTRAGYLRADGFEESDFHRPGDLIDHRYQVLGCLQKGGMSDVYRVAHIDRGREYALKYLPAHMLRDRRLVDRFQREARLLKRLVHPNVVRIHEFRATLGEKYIVMELAPGWQAHGALALDLGHFPLPLDFSRAVSIACELASAVSYMHSLSLIHRDIKPSNVLLFEDWHVKLTDFGLARQIDGQGATLSAFGAGTELYMSPEQLQGARRLSHATDLYSLGLVLFEIFSGRRPFERKHQATEISARLRDRPAPLSLYTPSIPAPIEAVIERCLRLDPDERPRNAAEIELIMGEFR